MSADTWTVCPRCHKKWVEPEKPNDPYAYGKVSEEEYLKHKDDPKPEAVEEPQSLAIYEEIDMDKNGVLFVLIKGECRTKGCGFKFRFEKSQKFL